MKKVRFSDVFDDITKNAVKIPTNEYLSNGLYQIIDQGQSDIAGYSNNETGLYTDVPVIVFGDHTRILKYIDKPLFLGADGVKLLKVKDRNLNCKYLFYALCNARIPDTGYNRHFKWLKEVEITIPSIDGQQKIASVLDKVSDLIALRKQQLAKLDELVKSRFVEMFGDMLENSMKWAEQKLEIMADIVSGITKGRKIQSNKLFDVPYMAVSNVKDGYIDWTTVKTIPATKEEIEQYRLLPNDVLMTEGGDPDKLGRGAIIRNPPQNCIHQNHIFRVRLNQKIIVPEFMEQYLQQQRAKKYFLRCAKQTTGIASINMKQLKALPTLIPPLSFQEQFAMFVHQNDKFKILIQRSLERLNILKKSLMQEYFG